jgi:hypothetical protein
VALSAFPFRSTCVLIVKQAYSRGRPLDDDVAGNLERYERDRETSRGVCVLVGRDAQIREDVAFFSGIHRFDVLL